MAELSTIARPYAEAAFKLARGGNSLASRSDALHRLSAVADRPELRQLIGNPKLGSAQLSGVLADAAGQLTEGQRNFVAVLVDNERVPALADIASQFESLRNREEGVLDAHVESAFPLSDSQVADITKVLTEKHGKKVKVVPSVNADLIGGVSIRIGDEVTDASVRGKLAQLAQSMNN